MASIVLAGGTDVLVSLVAQNFQMFLKRAFSSVFQELLRLFVRSLNEYCFQPLKFLGYQR